MRDPRIWKYPIPDDLPRSFTLTVPGGGSRFLSAQIQGGDHGEPVMWWLVDAGSHAEIEHRFALIMTGRSLPESSGTWTFLATLQFSGGSYVLHLFEEV